jgi:hypothetical protein
MFKILHLPTGTYLYSTDKGMSLYSQYEVDKIRKDAPKSKFNNSFASKEIALTIINSSIGTDIFSFDNISGSATVLKCHVEIIKV